MKAIAKILNLSTKGNGDIIDITGELSRAVEGSGIKCGTTTAFVKGSTAAITMIEYEPGLVHDINAALERIAPSDIYYKHHEKWHDDNGHSHVRASILGPSVVIPVVDAKLTLGTWQQIILVDFDTRARSREVVIQITGL